MGLALLAMLCLGRPDVPTFADPAQAGASLGLERSGEVVALPRVTTKPQVLEVRSARPAPAKFTGFHPALPAPQAVFLHLDRISPAAAIARSSTASAPRAGTNQPRAPPSSQA